MCYFANSAGSIPGALFAEKLIEKMPGMSRVYYTNSGSEANEKAFKMVRQIAHKKYGGKKTKILYRDRDYHGSTLARCLSAGGQDERNAQYGPFAPDFVACRTAWNTASTSWVEAPFRPRVRHRRCRCQIEEVILREGPETVGALCLEPVTAGGGVIDRQKATGSACRRSAKSTTCCCTSTRLSAVSGAPAPIGLATSISEFKPDFVTMAKGVASGLCGDLMHGHH